MGKNLRKIWDLSGRRRNAEYEALLKGEELMKEVQIYTWWVEGEKKDKCQEEMVRKDATLREIASLVKDAIPELSGKQGKLEFSLVYPDREGKMVMKKIGSVPSRPLDTEKKTLHNLSFQTGDFLDIAITM